MGLSHIVSGDIASFRTPSRVPIESLKFHFLPKQASGTPTPGNPIPIEGWTGVNGRRAGKNLYSSIGLIYGKWILGTGEVQEAMRGALTKEIPVSSGEVYSFSFNGSSYLPYSIEVVEYDKDKDYLRRNYSTRTALTEPPSDITFTIGSNTKYIVCGVFSTEDSAISQEKIESYKMQLERGPVSSYEPYSGELIPITFPSNGKNLYDINTYPLSQGYVLWPGNGTADSGYPNYATTLDFIPCENIAGRTITINRRPGGGNPGFAFYTEAKVSSRFAGRYNTSGTAGTPWTIEVPKEAKYMRFSVPANTYDIQIELGDTATSYEPYSSDNTFYGGYVDPVAGEIVAEFKVHTFNGEERIRDYPGTFIDGIRLVSEEFDDCTGAGNLTKCDKAPLETTVPSTITRLGIRIGGGVGRFYFYIPDSMFDGEATVDKFKEWLTENNMTVVAKLTTSIHIPIPAEDMKAFLDHNNFWSDANSITEVTYAVTESKDILDARKLIMDGSQPHLEDASGTIASFSTDMKAPVVDLKAYFTLVQEGSGDPSPQNVRPIKGRTKAEVINNKKNFAKLSQEILNADRTQAGITFHALSDSSVHIEGTATQDAFLTNGYFQGSKWLRMLKAGTYTLTSNFPNSIASGSVVYMYGYDIDGNNLGTFAQAYDTKDKTVFTLQKDSYVNIQMIVKSGATINHDVWVQIEKGSVKTDYEQHVDEIIPIEFPATKNLFNAFNYGQKYGGGFSVEEGSWHFDDVMTDNTANISNTDIFPAGTYTLSAKCSGTGIKKFRMVCSSSSCGGTWNNYYQGYFIDPADGENKITFTSTEEFTIKLVFVISSGHSREPGTIYNIQLERGSSATPYEPYGTVYGGYVDLVRGKLVVEWYGISVLWKDIKNARYSSATDQREGRIYFPHPLYKASTPGSGAQEKAICNVAKWAYADIAYQSTGHFYVSGGFNDGEYVAYIILPESTSDDTAITVVAEMVTPIEYDLTTEQIKAFKGQNNIWSDANGNVDVKYWTH